MIRSFLLAILVSINVIVSAQALRIGDKAPDLPFQEVLNYRSSTLRLTDFSGKVVILYYWGFNCISCLQSFPKIDSLQKEYKGKVQLVLVNTDGQVATEAFFKSRKKVKCPDVPLVTQGLPLKKLFPHHGVPYKVWIDPDGLVRYTTGGALTKATIGRFLAGEDLGFANDGIPRQEAGYNKAWLRQIQFSSFLSRCDPEKKITPDTLVNQHQLSFNCRSIESLYQTAYAGLTGYRERFKRPGKTIVEATDTYPYVQPKVADVFERWRKSHAYNYQLVLPRERSMDAFQVMRDDLDRMFQLQSGVEKRKVKCLVLVRNSDRDKLKTKGEQPRDQLVSEGLRSTQFNPVRGLYNQPFSKLSKKLLDYMEYNFGMPFLDETNYKGFVDFEVPGEVMDTPSLDNWRLILDQYGLAVVEAERWLHVLVIKEKGKQ